MSFRKQRVHQTGRSNADARTISSSPMRSRPPIHERTFYQNSSSSSNQFEDPIESTMQKYKAWNKKARTHKKKDLPAIEDNGRMKEDPPHFANVIKKVEPIRLVQKENAEKTDNLKKDFAEFVKRGKVNIKSMMIKADRSKKGNLSLEEFREILDNINAPAVFLRNSQMLYEELSENSTGLNYKGLNSQLFSQEVFLPQLDFYEGSQTALSVVDKRQVPLNQLEGIYSHARKIRNFLKLSYKSPESLLADLEQTSKNDHISMDSLKDFVLTKLEETKAHKPSRKEMESFLASYDYNKDKDTSVNEVVKYVFMDDILAASYLHEKRRAIPPLRDSKKLTEVDEKRLKQLLLNIEEKMFTQGPNQSLAVFKNFDKDNDGYLTLEDIEQGLKTSQIPHNSSDVIKLMEFLDENQNGFVTFSEFSKRVQPNILTVNHQKFEESEDKHFNISQPSTQYHLFQKSRLPVYNPPVFNEHKLKLSTRYSSSPAHQDTFCNFAAKPGSAIYMPDHERFSAKKFEPINLNHDDKHKLRKSAEARLVYLQKTREEYSSRIKEVDAKDVLLDAQRIEKKARVKSQYEVKCRGGLMS